MSTTNLVNLDYNEGWGCFDCFGLKSWLVCRDVPIRGCLKGPIMIGGRPYQGSWCGQKRGGKSADFSYGGNCSREALFGGESLGVEIDEV